MQAEIIRKIQMGAIYVVFFSLFLTLPTYSWLDYDSVRLQCILALQKDDVEQFEHLLQLTGNFNPSFESRQLKGKGIVSIIRIFNDVLEFAVSENTVQIFYYFLTGAGPAFNFSCKREFDFFIGQALTQGYNHKYLCHTCWLVAKFMDVDYEEPISVEECKPWIIRAIEQRNIHCLNVFLRNRNFEINQNYTPTEDLQTYIDYLNKCLSLVSQDDTELQSVFINILEVFKQNFVILNDIPAV